jgi:hypothetical protein
MNSIGSEPTGTDRIAAYQRRNGDFAIAERLYTNGGPEERGYSDISRPRIL